MHFGRLILITISLSFAALSMTVAAQDLGHKLPGLIGLDAGRIPEPGLYLVDRLVDYAADELRDRNRNVIPVGDLKLQGLSNAIGISYSIKFPQRSLTLTSTFASPLARLRLNVHDRPEANADRFGLADIYIQPARLGRSSDYFDVVGSYAVYVPTGPSPLAGGTGVSQGHVTHEFSLGGSIYANKNRDVFLTTLASYDHNLRKRNVDITRGDTFRIQGGIGVSRFERLVEAGIAGYGLWQVRDDRGGEIPSGLRGSRDQVYGVGPDVAVFIKAINAQIRARFAWDLAAQSRPKGNVFNVGINFVLWRPKRPVVVLSWPANIPSESETQDGRRPGEGWRARQGYG